jgi:hypothetical protein
VGRPADAIDLEISIPLLTLASMTLGDAIGFSVLGIIGILTLKKLYTMAGELDNLRTEVAENASAIDSAIALLNGLKTKLDEAIASGNMAEVQALSDELSNKTDSLAAAVTANTPAEDETGSNDVARP